MADLSRRAGLVVICVLSLMRATPVSMPQDRTSALPVFICPMHPDVIGNEGDLCPRCGMRLVATNPTDTAPPVLTLEVTPKAVKPGERAVMRFRVTRRSGEPVTQFQPLHERPMHVFLVSHRFDFFAHLHPEPAADGTFAVPVSLPHAGVYHAFVEFMAVGGTPQLMQRAFVTAGWNGGIGRTTLGEDVGPKVDRSVKMQIQLPADGLVAGRSVDFRCSISDAASGAPIHDLEPYLGTMAHVFLVGADLSDAAHVHPIPDFSDPAGPNLVFEALFPRAGQYRIWVQVQRRGQLYVTAFTVSVGPN